MEVSVGPTLAPTLVSAGSPRRRHLPTILGQEERSPPVGGLRIFYYKAWRKYSSILGLAGAGAGGILGSQLGGGGFTKPTLGGGGLTKPSLGSGGLTQPSLGSGGFTKPSLGNGGVGGFNTKPLGGGGFVTPAGGRTGSNFGSSLTNAQSNLGSSSGSNLLKVGGAGLAGGLAGGALSKGFKKNPWGVKQYSAFSKPKQSFGSRLFGGSSKKYGYKTPGYGTNWGTNFGGGLGKYGKQKKGFSKKALGLGIGAGFVGGAALGVAGTMATYSVYHKYQEFKRMMYMNQIGGMGGMGGMGSMRGNGGMGGWDDDYYNNNYLTNTCLGGCPLNSHCEWGMCECNAGTTRR